MADLEPIWHRLRNGRRTIAFPDGAPPRLPDRCGGGLRLDAAKCTTGCAACVAACPTAAVSRILPDGPTRLDLGRCVDCAGCVEACPAGAITWTGDHRLAARRREDLVLGGAGAEEVRLAEQLDSRLRSLFGRSLRLRQVSAGGCNACEADTNVLGTIGWDLGRFGIQFVASPRHADGLLVTGPVTANMRLALEKTYAAVPDPKLVIAVGACAIAGGPFAGNAPVADGVQDVLPVDLFIPGCPPHPLTILDGLLRLLGRLGERGAAGAAASSGPA